VVVRKHERTSADFNDRDSSTFRRGDRLFTGVVSESCSSACGRQRVGENGQ